MVEYRSGHLGLLAGPPELGAVRPNAVENNELTGVFGRDLLTGDADADRFIFASPTEGADTITDFAAVDDSLVFGSVGFGTVAGATVGAGTALTGGMAFAVTGMATARFLYESDGDFW